MKNTSFFITLISALFFSLPLTATAQDFVGGSGTEEEPYLVETAEHLDNVRNHLSAHFRQIADIDLSGYAEGEGWEPIGEFEHPFLGSYNGNGYTITNLVINRPYVANIGLFAYIGRDSKIVKASLKDIQVTGRNNVGGLAGRNHGNIIHSSATGDVFGSYQTGGIVGGNYTRGTITKSFFTGTVTGEKKVGGLVGYQYHFGGEIKSCYTIAEVSGDNMVGGLVGLTNGSISECYAKGKVSGGNDIGGLVGYNEEGTIINCYASASVSGSPSIGGLVGPVLNGVITNSYYDQETAGRQDRGKGVPKSTDEMKQKDTFQDWDFENTWSIIEGETYPFLRWELKAIFSTDTTEGVVPLNVKFTDQSTGDIDSWKWEFGNGNISEEQNPQHKYEKAGTYTVSLKVHGDGETNKVSKIISVNQKTIAEDVIENEIILRLPNNESITLMRIPSGSFIMGSASTEKDRLPGEATRRRVNIDYDFYMGKFTVTKAQWESVMGTTPWQVRVHPSSTVVGPSNIVNHPNTPAVNVSWNDIRRTNGFLDKLNTHLINTGQNYEVRLPLESEWEYAARAGSNTRFYWGDDNNYSQITRYAWYDRNAFAAGNRYPHKVGQKRPNEWGLYDMSGNIWEWCDTNNRHSSNRPVRGGGFDSPPADCRSAARYELPLSSRYPGNGFRVLAVPK